MLEKGLDCNWEDHLFIRRCPHTHLSGRLLNNNNNFRIASMAQVQLDKKASSSSKSSSKKTSEVEHKVKKVSQREFTIAAIAACVKQDTGLVGKQLPHTNILSPGSQYILCNATGLEFHVGHSFTIPLKAVKNVSTQLKQADYISQLPVYGDFISPLAILYFLDRHRSTIPNDVALTEYVLDYYRMDADFYKNQLQQLTIATKSKDSTNDVIALLTPSAQDEFNRHGTVSFHVPRPKGSKKRSVEEDSASEPPRKRQKVHPTPDTPVADDNVAQSIEDFMENASDVFDEGSA